MYIFKNTSFKIRRIANLLFLLALIVVPEIVIAGEPDQISVLTYNVNYGNPNLTCIKIIDTLDADIVCLQETNAGWEILIKEVLKNKYQYIEFRHCCNAGGLAILSKFPVVRSEYISNDIGWFPAWVVTIKTPRENIQLLNVHLKPGLNKKGKVGFLAKEFFKAQKIHISELELFTKSLDPNIPSLILGDFNENDKGKTMK